MKYFVLFQSEILQDRHYRDNKTMMSKSAEEMVPAEEVQPAHAFDRLVTDMLPVLFVGDGTGSFSLTVAALRNSFDDLVTTELKLPETEINPMLKQIGSIILNNDLQNDDKLVILETYATNLLPSADMFTVTYGVDATKLCDYFNTREKDRLKQNIFFQCPWRYPGSTAELMLEFLTSAASVQSPGDYLFIGYDTGRYKDRYGLDNFFLLADSYRYERLEDDFKIQQEAKNYGYYHYSRSGHDLNNILHLSTICLKKLAPDDVDEITAKMEKIMSGTMSETKNQS
jgi:hypothetical protein